jgi:lipoate-protein ligase A
VVTRKTNGFEQMAIDEALLDGVSRGTSPATVRFFDFEPAAITVGRLQRLDASILDACEKRRIDVVRRLSGGRTVVHAGDFTFSLVVHASDPIFGGSVYRTSQALSAPFLHSLHRIGVPAEWHKAGLPDEERGKSTKGKSPLCFDSTSRYELTVRGMKILGISQYRRGALLAQGSLLLKKPKELYGALFGTYGSTHGFASLDEVSGKSIDFGEFGDTLKLGFSSTYNLVLDQGTLSADECKRAALLARKYRSREWRAKGL